MVINSSKVQVNGLTLPKILEKRKTYQEILGNIPSDAVVGSYFFTALFLAPNTSVINVVPHLSIYTIF